MPALPPAAGVIKTQLHQAIVGSSHDVQNRLYWLYTGGAPSPTDLTSFLDAMMASWAANFHTVFSTGHTLGYIFGEDLASSSGSVANSTHAAVVGTDAAPVRSAQDAICVRHLITRRYRGGKPKSFWSGIGDSEYSSAISWDPVFVTNFINAMDAWIDAFESATYGALTIAGHASVSYYSGHTVVTHGNNWARNVPTVRGSAVVDAVIGITGDVGVHTQKRRLQ